MKNVYETPIINIKKYSIVNTSVTNVSETPRILTKNGLVLNSVADQFHS